MDAPHHSNTPSLHPFALLLGKAFNHAPDPGERVAAVGGEVLGDAGLAEERRVHGQDVGGGGIAVELA